MKNNKKPLIIILIMVLMVAGGLLLANYMFKQVDIKLDKEEASHAIYFDQEEHLSLIINEALDIANNLIDHDINELNVNIAKLSCLTNLNKLEEALIFVEGLLKDRCENYYVYLEVYLSLLYETNQFEEIMFVLDEEED